MIVMQVSAQRRLTCHAGVCTEEANLSCRCLHRGGCVVLTCHAGVCTEAVNFSCRCLHRGGCGVLTCHAAV